VNRADITKGKIPELVPVAIDIRDISFSTDQDVAIPL